MSLEIGLRMAARVGALVVVGACSGPLLPRHPSPKQPIDERMRERLRQLGYAE